VLRSLQMRAEDPAGAVNVARTGRVFSIKLYACDTMGESNL